MAVLPGLPEDHQRLVVTLGHNSPEGLTIADVLRHCERLTTEVAQTKDALTHAHGARMFAAMHPPPSGAVMSDEDAARLIFAKCTPETMDRFGLARETAPPGYTDCDIIAGLLTMLCNTNEQHTGHWEEIRPGLVTMPVGPQTRPHPATGTPPQPVAFGREPRPCKTCASVFTPQRQGQVFGCQACGEYANYVMRVEKDRQEHDPRRPLDAFDLWCLKQSQQCGCPGVTPRGHGVVHVPGQGHVPLTRARVVVDAQGREMVIDEPVEVGEGA
jgi:predicted RNA-binding Zn-ribbon protein involved in translation (DUF1610 family)